MPTESREVLQLKQAHGFHYSTFAPLENLSVPNLFIQKPSQVGRPQDRLSSDALNSFLEAVGLPKRPILSLKQVHSGRSIMVSAGRISESVSILGEADALFINSREFYLSVGVADCLPIYVHDLENKIIGLIHAGWRGTLLGIAQNSILKAKHHFGLNPMKCQIVLGPCIKPCCYKVSGEVAILFPESSFRVVQDSHYLDLATINVSQLEQSGVPSDHIFVARDCTCCNSDFYHSFRRTGDQQGRMYAILGLK